MIRFALVAVMLGSLCLALIVPLVTSPDQLHQTLRAQHDTNRLYLGQAIANHILERMLDFQMPSVSAPGESAAQGQAQPGAVNAAEVIGKVGKRLLSAPYFRAIDALLALCALRLFTVFHALPLLVLFAVATSIDGLVVRKVRAKEFVAHSVEMFTLSGAASVLLLGAVMLLVFVPVAVNPFYLIGPLFLMLFFASRAVGNYHLIR